VKADGFAHFDARRGASAERPRSEECSSAACPSGPSVSSASSRAPLKVSGTFDRGTFDRTPGLRRVYFGLPQDSLDGALEPALLIAVTT
jgi:hypothetical protein